MPRRNEPENPLTDERLPLFQKDVVDDLRVQTEQESERLDDGTEEPSLDEWRGLYEAGAKFRALAPWTWLFEDQMFAVVNPEDGEVGYCSVMGARGEFLALAVYLGEEGLLSYERMRRAAQEDETGVFAPNVDVFLEQKGLFASFESSQDVDKRDRAVFKELGLRFRGSQAWPVMRSREPGYLPWYVNAKECRFLTHALEQAVNVTARAKENPMLLDAEPGCMLTRVPVDGETPEASGDWADAWWAWPYVDYKLNEEEDAFSPQVDIELDEVRLRRVFKSGQSTGAWEVDVFYAPFSVHEGERPYFPRVVFFVHHQSGMVLSFELMEPGTDILTVITEQMLFTMEQHEMYPEQIVVCGKLAWQLMRIIAPSMGFDLMVAEFLPGIEAAKEGLQAFMR